VIALRPRTFTEALAMKAAHPSAVPVAGGTDVWVHWPTNLAGRDRTYLDLTGAADLREIAMDGGRLVLGATATYWDFQQRAECAESFPMLAAAARQIGAVQIQTRGTWAGNVANASPAADGVAALMAHGADVVLASARAGDRRVPLDAFSTGYRATVAAPDELIRAIEVPLRRLRFARFAKVGARAAQTISKTGAAVTRGDDGWRVAAISMAPAVCRCRAVEARLAAGAVAAPEDLLDAVRADVRPIDDLRSSAAYRSNVFARVVFALVEDERGSSRRVEGGVLPPGSNRRD
jgi:CO/xanthine dehydrogenase FAD-binding subunit